jgi:dolichyl-diphosphooligosaccharide---protein glycosyltransferase
MLDSRKTLLRTGGFEFHTRHLLIIAVLAIAFTTAFIIRSYPAKYGFYLNEFDPYFDYRATKFIVDNGLEDYWRWHDTMSWYPEGRDIPKTSQSGLHIVAAYLYLIFGKGISLLDFTIILPVILGSLTTIIVFALVRSLGGTTAGMFAALLFAFTPSIIQRGNLGWFKSEPLGLFFGLLSIYLFISAIKHREKKYAIAKAVAGGLILGLANASWGGVQYFSIPLSIFFICLPFFRKDIQVPMYVAIAFTIFTLVSAGAFPRPGISFVFGLPGIALIGSTAFLIIANFLKKISQPRTVARNTLFLLIAFFIIAIGFLIAGTYYSSSFRYLNAINPFLSSQNPLVESVAEHFTPTLVDYFTDYSILLMFAGFGAWMAFKRRDDMSIFALIIGLTGVYVSATFARLMVFSSIGIIVLAALGLYEVTRSILEYREHSASRSTTIKSSKSKKRFEHGRVQTPMKRIIRIAYVVIIIFMLSIPLLDYKGILYPQNSNWLSSADVPPSIANGGTGYRLRTDDWINALDWISKNTPKDAVIAAWWDYGYWITTLGNRTSLADNATINQTRIATLAKMFMEDEEQGIKIAKDLKADYILVYVVGQRYGGVNGTSFYTLGNGGDESKKQWFIRIGGFNELNYLEQDGFTPTSQFWNRTLLGHLIPFTPVSYASFQQGVLTNIQPQYQPGSIALHTKNIKYPDNTEENQPLRLVYSSDSFRKDDPGLVFGVLIYKVNYDYYTQKTSATDNLTKENMLQKPISLSQNGDGTSSAAVDSSTSNEIAVINTTQGIIKTEFFPNAAPNHIDNFKKLAQEGFYNGTLFHRINKDFVIQGGDPNTRLNGTGREQWGTGGPGFSLPEEFNSIPHERGIVSMARSSDPNSAGSQFFIVLNESRFLDNQYTVFGRVIEGMDVVDKIGALPTIYNNQPTNLEAARIQSISIKER